MRPSFLPNENIRDLTQGLDSGRQNEKKLSRETVHSHCYASFFQRAAVLSLPVVLLHKVSSDLTSLDLGQIWKAIRLRFQVTDAKLRCGEIEMIYVVRWKWEVSLPRIINY